MKKFTSRLRRQRAQLRLEALEERVVPAGTWQNLSASGSGPTNGLAMILLSDGTVAVQGGSGKATNTWYRLTPDSSGNYDTGAWSALGSMNVTRRFFPTVMLPNGNVFAAGGEYTNPSKPSTATDNNTSEIFNPLANGGSGSWTSQDTFPATNFGDEPMEVLPDGRVLTGEGAFAGGFGASNFGGGTQTYFFDPTQPAGSQWSNAATRLTRFDSMGNAYYDSSDEEAWTKLPDGSILTYDIWASGALNTFYAERYIPAGTPAAQALGQSNVWVDASTLSSTNPPSILESNGNQGRELGPGLLMPNGKVIYFGANGNTAIYDPTTDTWSAGFQEPQKNLTITGPDSNGNYDVSSGSSSDTPTYLVATDDPGAVLPNGKILIALSPLGPLTSGGGYSFPLASYLYEYDPTATTQAAAWTEVTPSLSAENAFNLNMVVLPSGKVLMDDEGGGFQIYSPDGGPQDAWRPTITRIVQSGTNTYTLTGTQLNGIDEGANYGDDMESASNYPIIQFTDAANNVYYGRTTTWSSTGVATGSTPVTVQFTLPSGKSLSDLTTVIVIANGIPSNPTPLDISPNLTAPADQTSTEGAPQTFNLGSFTDPDGGPWTVDVNWGDGTPDTVFTATAPGTITPQGHPYGEEGTKTATITVTDTSDNQSDSKTFKVTVTDPPVVQASAITITPVEGAAFTGTAFATFTDPGGAEPNPSDPTGGIPSHYAVVSIDWGDSTPLDTTSGAISFGGSPGSKTDPFTVSGSHTYGEEGTYTITVVINHEGVKTTLTSTATVTDPPVVQASAITITPVEGAAFTGTAFATFTDPGGAEPNPSDPAPGLGSHYTVVSIDWGDSTPLDTTSGAISYSGSPGSQTDPFTVSGSHTYGEEGTYTIHVIIDHEGEDTTLTSTANVSDPPVLASGVAVTGKEGIAFSAPVATFTDPGGAEPNSFDPTPGIASHYTATIDWGDGTLPSAGTITYAGSPGSKTGVFTVTGSHTVAEEGNYNITVTINHEGVITTAKAAAAIRDNYGLLLLDTTGSGALTVTGNGTVTVNNTGAVVDDSSDPRAIFLTGNAVVSASEADVGLGGGAVTTGHAVLNLSEPEFNHEAATPDPIALPLPPMPSPHFAAVNYSGSALLPLSPGTYNGGIQISGKGQVMLLPGVYYMNGGGFSVSGQGSVTGSGVLIVNAPIKPNDTINLSGQASVSLTPPTGLTGAYAAYNGITILQAPASANPITVSGQVSLTMTGVLYAPKALLQITGNGDVVVSTVTPTSGGEVIVFDALVSGNGVLTINADPAPAFQLAAGGGVGLAADDGALLGSRSALRTGPLLVAVTEAGGAPGAAEQARIADAIAGLNAVLGPFGVDLILATAAQRAAATIHLDIAGTTDFGGVAAGILAVTEQGNAITVVSGWDWYVGADPNGIGPRQFDFETVVVHELAHAVGLGEGTDPTSVMYTYLASGVARRTLSAGDLGFIAAVEGEGWLPAPAVADVGAIGTGPGAPAVPADSGGHGGPTTSDTVSADTAAEAAVVAALEVSVAGTSPGGTASATPPTAAAGDSDIAGPRVVLVVSSSARSVMLPGTSVADPDDPVAPADTPAAIPAAVPGPGDGAAEMPRGAGRDGTDAAAPVPREQPPAPAAPASDEAAAVLPREALDAYFAAGVEAPVIPPPAVASEGGWGALQVAAGLALGLGGWWVVPRREENLRRRSRLK